MQYDIFISYKRRGTSSATAAYLYELLLKKGYNVFFDRKEMRAGKFDEQLLEHISNATDIIILLENESLESWFKYKDQPRKEASLSSGKISSSDKIESALKLESQPYQTDWFCREVMHALSLKEKNIIPLLLDGYKMPESDELPPELKELSLQNAINLDISEIEECYQKYFVEKEYLKSKPKNLAISRQYQNKGAIVGNFLFYTEAKSCDLFEFGEKIITLTDDNDEDHPFKYPVSFAGEHRFKLINNDTCEEVRICQRIETNCQEYINVEWTETQNLWELTDEDVGNNNDAGKLYNWGCGLCNGTATHESDFDMGLVCLKKASDLGSEDALNALYFIVIESDIDEITENSLPIWLELVKKFNEAKGYFKVGKWLFDQNESENSFHYLKISADRGYASAQLYIGWMYDNGKGVREDKSKAVEWYIISAEQGDAIAQYYLGVNYEYGIGVEQDYSKAFEWYSKSAEQGYPNAQENLALMYYNGYGVEQNYSTAFEWLTKAAEQGDDEAQCKLGIFYENGLCVEQDYSKAVEFYSMAAEQGNAGAQTNLGRMYENGLGVEQDFENAVKLYSMAVEQGDADAQYNLGRMYENGLCVEQDFEKAAEWYEKSAEQGNGGAQNDLGVMFQNGDGVEQDFSKAFELYTKSAEQGYPNAQENLALMYYNGYGVEQNYSTAFEWLTKAAEQGCDMAQFNLAIMYGQGQGTEQNLTKASEWFTKAAEQGLEDAFNNLAWTYHLMGKYDEALPWAEKAVESSSDDTNNIDTLATVYQDLRRYDEAMEQFELCLKLKKEQGCDEESIKETEEKIEELKELMNG